MYYVGQRSNSWVTRSKNKSNFENTITPLIFELQRGSNTQNRSNALGYPYSIPNFRWRSRRKSSPGHQNFVTFENFKILKISTGSLNLTSDMERSYANNPRKIIFLLMTSPVTSHHDDKISLLYSCLNEISTFSGINHKHFNISSHFVTHSSILAKYRSRSRGQKVGQILKLQ